MTNMKTKALALFLLLNLFSATSVFASNSSANTSNAKTFNALSSFFNYGGMARVEIHNHTDWTVSVYIDGNFVDNLRPHSNMTVPTGSGLTRLFASADCGCGTSVTWSSTYFYYAGYTYPWILNR